MRPVEDILSHPRFPEIRLRKIEATLATYGVDAFPGRLSAAAGRVVLISLLMGFIESDAPNAPQPTPTRLKELMARFDLYSPRQVDALLSRLVQTGYVDVVVHPRDGRVRLLRPLNPLADWYWSYLDVYYQALQALFPAPGFDLIIGRERAFLPFIARAGSEPQALAGAMKMLTRDPAVVQFQARGGGKLLLYAILQLHARAPDREIRELDLVPFGRVLGRSRSHMRNLIALAVETGFLSPVGGRQQGFQPTPALIATMDQFIADTFRSSEMAYRRAEAAFRAAKPE